MSDLNENKNLEANENDAEYVDEYGEFGTVFSDPTEHRAVKPRGNRKRIIAIVSAVLAVAILIGGTVAVIRLIPKKKTDDTSSPITQTPESHSLVEIDESDVSEVIITNENGSFTFTAKQEITESESSSSTTTSWVLAGENMEFISSDKISSKLSSVLSVSSTQPLAAVNEEICGFEAPTYTAVITKTDGSAVTVTVGKEYAGQDMYCVKTSAADTVYLVDKSSLDALGFNIEDLYRSFSVEGVDMDKISENYVANATLASFDKLTISGSNFPKALEIVMNDDEQLSGYLPYLITSPERRLASDTSIAEILAVFSSGLSSEGIYSTDVKSSSLNKYGLNKPYLTISIKAGEISSTIKISAVQDDGYYAAVSDNSTVICKIAASSLSFIGYNTESFYGRSVYMSSINELSNMTFTAGDVTHSFDIVYDSSEDAEETYVITCDGKKITASYFQNFYQEFVGLQAADFDTSSSSQTKALSIRLTYSSDNSTKTIDFYPSSATKYLYEIDGKPMGRVATTSISNIINLVERVAQNKDIG